MTLRTWEPRPTGEDTELDELIDRFGDTPGAVIPVLQAVQELRGHISEDALTRIAARTGIPVSRLLGVATFYAQFRLEPVGRHVVKVCHGTACHVAGSGLIQQAIEDELGVGDGATTEDGIFTLNKVACLGCCSLAPAMMIGTEVHARLTPDKVRRIVRRVRKAEAGQPAKDRSTAKSKSG
jgi:NADH-quinone oxidoreductase subunit E